jgi:polyhydroxyalkanoate synthase subunit PhaC
MAVALLTSAVAPTNTLAGNPAALKRTFETSGLNLLRGARNFVHDVRHNGGMPSQVNSRAFRVGENLAATPGAVVYRDDICEVIQNRPATPEVRTRPVLMIPPQINRYYFMDLAPGRSFIGYAVSQGIQFFTISWRNPTPEQSRWDLDDYVAACLRAIGVVTDVTGGDEVATVGLSAGGITMATMLSTMATMLSTMAAESDERVKAAGFGVTLPEPGADPDAWRAAGTERVGTWWQRWAERIADRAGPERRSPQKLGSRKHKAGDPAPGQYIHSR